MLAMKMRIMRRDVVLDSLHFVFALTLHKWFLCGLCVSYLNAIVCFIFLCRLSLVDISRQTLPEDTSEIEGPKSVWSFRLLLKIVNTAVIETVRSLLLVHLSPSNFLSCSCGAVI